MSLSTRRFLKIAVAIIAITVMSAFSSITASAQCTCRNSITLDPNAPCCIRLMDITVECDGGPATQPAFPGAGPFDDICRGGRKIFPCPCPNFISALVIAGVTIPVGASMDVLYAGDCCLNFTVNSTPGGCVDIVVTPGTICSLDHVQPRLMGSLLKVWPYARG